MTLTAQASSRHARSLLREPKFAWLWLAMTVSSFGAQITLLALPLAAVLLLNATPLQMGIMVAFETVPFSLFALHAGVYIDRVQKLPLLVIAHVIAGLTLLVVPLMAMLGLLTLPLLYVVAFVQSTIGVVAGTALQVFTTEVAGRKRLIEANSLLTTSESAARLLGPGLAGLLVQSLGAPYALVCDAVTLLVAAAMLWSIDAQVSKIAANGRARVMAEIGEGLRFVAHHSVLRVVTVCSASWYLLLSGFMTLVTIYATRVLFMSAAQLGLAYVAEGAGALAAAASASAITRRFGMGKPILWGIGLCGISWMLVGQVPAGPGATLRLGAALLLAGFAITAYWINYASLRQAITPDPLLGRMTATMRFFTVAPAPLGALGAGFLANHIGIRATIVAFGACALAVGVAALLGTKLRAVPDLSTRTVAPHVTDFPPTHA